MHSYTKRKPKSNKIIPNSATSNTLRMISNSIKQRKGTINLLGGI